MITTLSRYRQRYKYLVVSAICFLVGLRLGSLPPSVEDIPKRGHVTTPTPSKNKHDVCVVADAVNRNRLSIKSYFPLDTVTIPSDVVPHVSSVLCSSINGDTNRRDARHWKVNAPLKSIFAFKAARTGSTLFTEVITNTIKHMGLPASMFWEPYAKSTCQGPIVPTVQQENALRALLTEECIIGPEPAEHKCFPDKICNATENDDTVFVTATNPRFLNPELHWQSILDPETRIFSLRRTNLVLMSYSKYRHGGCTVDDRENVPGPFTLEVLLRCVEHFALGDQELSASVALHAASTASTLDPLLVVYEDVITNGTLVQKGITNYLGVNITVMNMFQETDVIENSHVKTKMHSNNICIYDRVNCDALIQGLVQDYPCLYKQLKQAESGLTWTAPMLENGTISIHGDCKPLRSLSEESYVRDFYELYQLPHK